MNTSVHGARSLNHCARSSNGSLLPVTVSVLFKPRKIGFFIVAMRATAASVSSVGFLRASNRNSTASASAALPHAADTIARSNGCSASNTPGTSRKTHCVLPLTITPVTRLRVVCALGVTIEIFAPTRRFNNVDFPAFGAPIRATVPQRVEVDFGFDFLLMRRF